MSSCSGPKGARAAGCAPVAPTSTLGSSGVANVAAAAEAERTGRMALVLFGVLLSAATAVFAPALGIGLSILVIASGATSRGATRRVLIAIGLITALACAVNLALSLAAGTALDVGPATPVG